MGIDGKSTSKCTPARVKNCLKTFLVHLFSHVGLCVLVVGYAVIGGFIFKELEHQTDEDEKLKAELADAALNRTRKQHVSNLWSITDRLNVLYESNWTQEVEVELEKFEQAVKDSRDMRIKIKWTFSSALLYSVSIITTIGYGNIFPRTLAGKMFTMLYAVIGVPLMLLWVSNIGNVMAHAFKFAYFHAPFCGSSTSSSNKEDSNRKTVQSQRLKKNSKKKSKSKEEKSPSARAPPDSGVSTQVEFSLVNEKCETVLLEQESSPQFSLQRSPSTPTKRTKSRGSRGSKKSLKDLDSTTRQILFECAEYNLSNGEETDERMSAELLQQLNSTEDRDEVDDASGSKRSSDVESVIEIISSSQGRFTGSSTIPPPPTFDVDTDTLKDKPLKPYDYSPPNETGKRNGNRKISVIDSLQLPHGTPSRVPLLADRDVMEIEIERLETEEGIKESSNLTDRRVPVSLVLFIVVLYIVLGASVFSIYEEEWYFWESAYFCFITLSTIGLGDMTPGKSLEHSGTRESTVQLLFCCFYLVIGLAIIAMSFNLVQEQVTIKVTEFAKRIGIIEDKYT